MIRFVYLGSLRFKEKNHLFYSANLRTYFIWSVNSHIQSSLFFSSGEVWKYPTQEDKGLIMYARPPVSD